METSVLGRIVALIVTTSIFSLLGCPGDESSAREMTIVVEADTDLLQEREGQLARQRGEIEEERARLLQERQALISRMERGDDLARMVEDQRRILEQEQRLRQQESLAQAERSSLADEVTRIVQGAASASLAAPNASPADPVPRGSDISRRESSLADREADLASREKAIAEREAALALREAEGIRLAASAAVPSEPGRRVSPANVQEAHRRARNTMQRRGILVGDLPPEVAALDRRFYDLSRRGRWNEALDVVDSLSGAISSILVDDAFIQEKMIRLGRARQSKQLSAEQGRQVEDLLAAATGAFADGKYSEANIRLNRIWAILSD